MTQADAVNVGWLDAGHDFATGAAPAWLVPRIARLIVGAPVNVTRGYHPCGLCQDPPFPVEIQIDGLARPLGDREIRVRGPDGTLYAAPSLVAHYIAEHGYLPPPRFIDAVWLTVNAS